MNTPTDPLYKNNDSDKMNKAALLQLLDHPTPDADAPHNPVLTAHILARVHDEKRTARIAARADISLLPWSFIVCGVIIGFALLPLTGVAEDGGLSTAIELCDIDTLIEIVIGALIAGGSLALAYRRFA